VREVLNETTRFIAQPYSVAKVYGHWITINYRESSTARDQRDFVQSAHPVVGWNLSNARSVLTRRRSNWDWRTNCCWTTWTRGATGVMPGITSAMADLQQDTPDIT
jgi:hypothetical protein